MFDIDASPLLVFDLDDDSTMNSKNFLKNYRLDVSPLFFSAAKFAEESRPVKLSNKLNSKVCLSFYTFGVLAASCTVILLTTIILFASYCYHKRETKI